MKCPGCAGEIEKNCQYVCRTCWPKVPAKDRVKLANMHVKRIDVTTKLAKIARELRAKNGLGIDAALRLDNTGAAPELRVEIIEGACHRER